MRLLKWFLLETGPLIKNAFLWNMPNYFYENWPFSAKSLFCSAFPTFDQAFWVIFWSKCRNTAVEQGFRFSDFSKRCISYTVVFRGPIFCHQCFQIPLDLILSYHFIIMFINKKAYFLLHIWYSKQELWEFNGRFLGRKYPSGITGDRTFFMPFGTGQI